jgi:hypothetical protein
MKCPYCGEKGAKVLPNAVCPERLIHSAINCRNPECTAYDPITHGAHPKMLAETKAVLQTVLRAMRSESDFDLTYLKHLRA